MERYINFVVDFRLMERTSGTHLDDLAKRIFDECSLKIMDMVPIIGFGIYAVRTTAQINQNRGNLGEKRIKASLDRIAYRTAVLAVYNASLASLVQAASYVY